MKITNLIEDTEGVCDCLYEHGLSFYIETAKHKLLLDTGATDAFLRNAGKKGIDLTAVDTVIISHGHYDHAGGLLAFTKINPHAKVYIHKNAVGEFYNLKNGGSKYIGMDQAIAALPQVVFLEGDLKIDETLSLFTGVKGRKLWPRGNEVLKKKQSNTLVQDEFDHEQYLVVTEGARRVLLSGCAHNGILNILDAYRTRFGGEPTHVVSGFHTTRPVYSSEDNDILEDTARALAATNTVYYSGHCTGEYPLKKMKAILGEKLVTLHSGDEIF